MRTTRIVCLALACVMVCAVFAGCQAYNFDLTDYVSVYRGYSNEQTLTDYVKAGNFSDITIKQSDINSGLQEVKDSLIEEGTQTGVEKAEDEAVEEGDTTIIDYKGTYRGGEKDGEAFDGGTASSYNLKIGSGGFIDGFEDGLIGHKKGETVKLDLTFPEDYTVNTELAGVDVTFEVTINKITHDVAPEYNDALVAKYTSFKTVEEFEARKVKLIKASLALNALMNVAYANKFNAKELNKTYKNLYESQVNYYVTMYYYYFGSYPTSTSTALSTFGTSESALQESCKKSAATQSKQSMVLYTIIRNTEGLDTVSDEDYAYGLIEAADSQGYGSYDEDAGEYKVDTKTFEKDVKKSAIYESIKLTNAEIWLSEQLTIVDDTADTEKDDDKESEGESEEKKDEDSIEFTEGE